MKYRMPSGFVFFYGTKGERHDWPKAKGFRAMRGCIGVWVIDALYLTIILLGFNTGA